MLCCCNRQPTMQPQCDSRVCRTISACPRCLARPHTRQYKIKLEPYGSHAPQEGLERSNATAMLWELESFENTAKPVPRESCR